MPHCSARVPAQVLLAPGGFHARQLRDLQCAPLVRRAAVEALFPDDAQIKFRLPYELHDESVVRELLASAHFGEPVIETVRIPIAGVDPHALAEGQVRGTPRSALLLERGVALEGVIEAVAAQLAQAGGHPYSGHAQAKLVHASAAGEAQTAWRPPGDR